MKIKYRLVGALYRAQALVGGSANYNQVRQFVVGKWWMVRYTVRHMRRGDVCDVCGKPHWYWWEHYDCIPF